MTLLRPAILLAMTASLAACATAPPPIVEGQKFVMASLETDPAGARGDAADDPAFWRHPVSAEQSLILGTNKQEGLVVYALDGSETQRLPIGRINNVDIRQSPDRGYDVAVASNDQVNVISMFFVDRANGAVTHQGDIATNMIEPYGICQGRQDGQDYVAVTYKDGTVQIWAIAVSPEALGGELLNTLKFETQLEGCVFDETNDTLFIGEENHGLWAVPSWLENTQPVQVDTIGSGTGLVGDVEGVSIWRGANGEGWVVASAQEEDRYVVYDRKAPYAHRGSFSIIENPALGIDAVTHTDGLDIYSAALPGYPRGILMVQDDGNPRSGQDQNFKIVSWADVETALGLPLLMQETE